MKCAEGLIMKPTQLHSIISDSEQWKEAWSLEPQLSGLHMSSNTSGAGLSLCDKHKKI